MRLACATQSKADRAAWPRSDARMSRAAQIRGRPVPRTGAGSWLAGRCATPVTRPGIAARPGRVRQVLQIGLGHGSGGHGLSGLTELSFLELFEVVHVEIAVGLEPVFVGLDRQ